MTLDAVLSDAVRRFGDRPALTLWGQDLSYRELGAAVDRWADRLSNEGVAAGQRVAIVAPNMPCLVVSLLAAWRLGAVALPLNARWREYDLGRALQDAEPSALISVASYQGYSFAEVMPRLLPACCPTVRRCFFMDAMGGAEGELAGPAEGDPEPLEGETALILYTSGTTGAPKGALIRQVAQVDGARAMNDRLSAAPEDVCLFVIPVSHAFGLMCLVAALAAGSQAVMVESTFSPEPMIEAICRHKTTVLHGSPALFASLLKRAPSGLPALRTGFVAGAPCPPPVIERMDGIGMRLLNLYGMTEIGAAASTRAEDSAAVRYSTVGSAFPGFEFRIDADAGGEVQVRGPYVTPGYFRQPAQTAAAFKDGWFCTGDLGSLDEQGNLRISGRAKELVTVGGNSVFPAEVEGFLLTHPDVLQAAVVGVPHAAMGETLQAFVVPRPASGLTPAALLQYARANIAGYKLPYAIELLPELPLLASGKPDRAALRRDLMTSSSVTAETQRSLRGRGGS
jgi:acyl-CoA synthetase (AMP-forming)/AMP-acid ligase II